MHEIAAFAIQQDIFALSCADGDFVAEQRRDSAACKPHAVDDDFAADFSAVFCAQRIAAARLFRRRYFETSVQLRAVIHGVADCRYRKSVRAYDAARGRVQRRKRFVGNVLFQRPEFVPPDDFQPRYAVFFAAPFQLFQRTGFFIGKRDDKRTVVAVFYAELRAQRRHHAIALYVEFRFQRTGRRVEPRVHDAAVRLACAHAYVAFFFEHATA